MNGRARRAVEAARRGSLVVELLAVVVLLGYLAGWFGVHAVMPGLGLLALGWLLHDDGRPRQESTR